jgi:hypothetical protein
VVEVPLATQNAIDQLGKESPVGTVQKIAGEFPVDELIRESNFLFHPEQDVDCRSAGIW